MSGRLEGRGVVVTGATKGLGRETALLMAAEGARVVAVGRDEADGRSLLDEAGGLPGSVAFHAGDVRDEETHTGAIARCREEGRPADQLAQAAGRAAADQQYRAGHAHQPVQRLLCGEHQAQGGELQAEQHD